MNMKKLCLVIFSFLLIACVESEDSKINSTLEKFIEQYNSNKLEKIENLIGLESNARSQNLYSLKCVSEFTTRNKIKLNLIDICFENKLDNLSRKRATFNVFNGFDSVEGYKLIKIHLFFGPPQIINLDKLSDLEVETEFHTAYRHKLFDEGKLKSEDAYSKLYEELLYLQDSLNKKKN